MASGTSRCELSQRFFFEAAHTLHRTVETEGSKRIHGHTYHAEVTVCGIPDEASGMVLDLGYLRAEVAKLRDLAYSGEDDRRIRGS
jgi:6-pyruvoyltetrahydropterin/6-carboxytetrahydropterin synthase